ncbi:MAG: hypothetical protein BWX87_02083 [Bacteroidetes bacterium ADurb.Bin123]|nr:MAG: hypothetical protein BWX87_02083 [Bacteroidetes bacterium ADurb.Bin123]
MNRFPFQRALSVSARNLHFPSGNRRNEYLRMSGRLCVEKFRIFDNVFEVTE